MHVQYIGSRHFPIRAQYYAKNFGHKGFANGLLVTSFTTLITWQQQQM